MFAVPNMFIVVGMTFLIVVFMLACGWWLLHDQPKDKQKFSWHQMVLNSFYISLIDDEGKLWTLDIFYNEDVEEPTYLCKTERSMQIKLPMNFTHSAYKQFISNLTDVDRNFKYLITGVLEENRLGKLHFTKEDISTYREFKRYLLLKALRR